MAGRVSQSPVEVLYAPDEQRARVSQSPVEVLYAPDERRGRVSQLLVEVLYKEKQPARPAQIIWVD